jgi:hypothetical protein
MMKAASIHIGVIVGALVAGAVVLRLRWFVRDVFRSLDRLPGKHTLVCPQCGGTGRKLGLPQETWMPCRRCNGSRLR